jgi:hypothetical protein
LGVDGKVEPPAGASDPYHFVEQQLDACNARDVSSRVAAQRDVVVRPGFAEASCRLPEPERGLGYPHAHRSAGTARRIFSPREVVLGT